MKERNKGKFLWKKARSDLTFRYGVTESYPSLPGNGIARCETEEVGDVDSSYAFEISQ